MTQDVKAGIASGGMWTPYNKIRSVTKTTTSKLTYQYDAAGNRITKRFYELTSTLSKTTWYVRDAQGNTLAVYTKPSDSSTVRQSEVMLYGSSRLGLAYPNTLYSSNAADTVAHYETVHTRTLGARSYELSDHLGNVRATISDIALNHSGNFDAELVTATDYYPFGMILGGRNYAADGAHRYGFNGKENDNEVKGEGNQQDYGFRIYDTRIARFLSVDPLLKEYPWYTPYQFAGNMPIHAIDIDGLEPFVVGGSTQDFKALRHTQLRKSMNGVVEILGLNDLSITPVDYGFSWSSNDRPAPKISHPHVSNTWNDPPKLNNDLLNDSEDRALAGRAFADYVVANHVPGQPITLLGYSHGGNVVLQAVPLIRARLVDAVINVVTLFTPAENSKGSKENPASISSDLDAHFHFYSSSDKVVPLTGRETSYYNNPLLPGMYSGGHDRLLQVDVDKSLRPRESPAGHNSIYEPDRVREAAKSLAPSKDD